MNELMKAAKTGTVERGVQSDGHIMKSSTELIIKNLGFDVDKLQKFHNDIHDIFDADSEFCYMNDVLGLGKIITKTAGGVTLYLPYLDVSYLAYPNFDCYHNEVAKDSQYIVDKSLKDKIEITYSRLSNDDKGLFVPQYRDNHEQATPEGLSKCAVDLLSAVKSLMFLFDSKKEISIGDIYVYRYGDYYHFSIRDYYNPAIRLLDLYHAFTIYLCPM